MSSAFSANQYEGAFKSNRLQNWTLPKSFKERPSAAEGNTKFIATEQGHLLPGVKRGSSWTTFQGTWDLPSRLPPIHINPTARSKEGQERLMTWGKLQNPVLSGTTGKHHEAVGRSRADSRTPHDENSHVDQLDDKIDVSTKDGPQPEMQKSVCQASKDHSRPGTQQSQASPRPGTQQSQASPRPGTQQSQGSPRPGTQQSQASPRPGTQQSQAYSRPPTQQSQAYSRHAIQQSQAYSRPATQQSQAYSRPASKKTHVEPRPATQQYHAESRPVSQQSQGSRPSAQVSKAQP